MSKVRSSIREHLALLANLEGQRQYERDVPIADVSAELFCIWFGDTYFPESPAHQQAFTPSELAALEAFSAMLLSISTSVGEIRDVADLQARREWPRLAAAAAAVLQQIPGAYSHSGNESHGIRPLGEYALEIQVGLTSMTRRRLSFEESCRRPCALRLTECGGPTASGLDGHACENCLAYIVSQFGMNQGLRDERCGYCGGRPAYVGDRGAPMCETCAKSVLKATRSWYNLRSEEP